MVHAKKSLGQNFLNSKGVARDIVHAAALSPEDTVLEIGPGKGFLTRELLESGASVVAVEKDDRMIPLLEERFAEAIGQNKLALIHGDIVELLESDQKFFIKILGGQSYKLVANIPYYLTGYILRAFLEAKTKPSIMVLMVQKEVATRIVARDKKESILSIAVKAYGTPRLIKKVPARYFTPSPRVDSAILLIENISNRNFVNTPGEKNFFEILKTGFAHKRKVLAGNIKELLGNRTSEILGKVGIKENARAEDVSLEQWLALMVEARNQQSV
jgi:16S rRNA (adenine1518-N6/adenine1519-N6)-dimethyltransferase